MITVVQSAVFPLAIIVYIIIYTHVAMLNTVSRDVGFIKWFRIGNCNSYQLISSSSSFPALLVILPDAVLKAISHFPPLGTSLLMGNLSYSE